MKRAVITILILIVLTIQVSGLSGVIINPLPQDDPVTINFSQSVVFESNAVLGVPPYTFSWTFCNPGECTPETSSLEDPGAVQFLDIGTHTITLGVSDSDTPANMTQDTFQVISRMTYILGPQTDTGWNVSEVVTFRGIAAGGLVGNVDYRWDWGDGTPPLLDPGVAPGVESVQTHIYTNPGIYTVDLLASDQDVPPNSESMQIVIYVIDPTPSYFNCTIRYVPGAGCKTGELELMRMYAMNNSHAFGFDSPNRLNYDYAVCCNSTMQTYVDNETPQGISGLYAPLQNDSEAQTSGAHRAHPNNPIQAYYYILGFLGEAINCQTVVNESCSNYDQICVYEYADEEIPEGGNHFGNCTNQYPNRLCCGVGEDCTNNLDDDNNNWADTADNDFQTGALQCQQGVCGLSTARLLPECTWMDAYCDPDTEQCDFSMMGRPSDTGRSVAYWVDFVSPAGYVVSDYFSNCGYIWDIFTDTIMQQPGSSGSCPITPDFWDDWQSDPAFLAAASSWGVNEFELYNRCRYYHCSRGINGTLPPYVADMQNDGYLTRHICRFNQFWDPLIDNGDGTFGACATTSECYDPMDPQSQQCNYSYVTERDLWITQAMPNDPDWDADCFDSTTGVNTMACCPVWQGADNSFNYVNIDFYLNP